RQVVESCPPEKSTSADSLFIARFQFLPEPFSSVHGGIVAQITSFFRGLRLGGRCDSLRPRFPGQQRVTRTAISGTGLFVPPDTISNEELVASFNDFAREHNAANAREIATGKISPILKSS